MDLTLLIQSAIGLLIILAILVFLLVLSFKSKKKNVVEVKQKKPSVERENRDLEYLKSILKKKKTSTKDLKNTLDLIIKDYGTIHKKLGTRTHPDFDIYMNILVTICRHPNINKDIILQFDKELQKLNPEYKPQINDAISKGLTSRG